MRTPRFPGVLAVLAVAAAGLVVAAPPASAQATRTWVSGTGDDANPCSRTAACKTWAGAISKTAAGGVIDALDDGGFGAVTITKSLTLDGGSHVASALVNGNNGITINAPSTAHVVLRGIDVKGVSTTDTACDPTSGVSILGAASVRLDDVTISGFKNAVDAPLTNSSPDLYVDLSFNDLRVADNCSYGVHVAPAPGHAGRLTLDGSTITGSNVALSVGGGAEAWVSNSRLYLNNLGVQPAGGKIHSVCNNQVRGNATDGSFTDDLCGSAAVTPPPPAQLCTVPKLKKKSVAKAGDALEAAGCTLGKVKKHHGTKKQKGKVVSQNVAAGIQVKAGTAVGIVVGK